MWDRGKPCPYEHTNAEEQIVHCDPERHHRRSVRLHGYDYAQTGLYYVTICSHNHECLFGEICDGQMHLNQLGTIAHTEWESLPERFPDVQLDAFVVMPNHLHGVVALIKTGQTVLGTVIGGFKSLVFKRWREFCLENGVKGRLAFWQRPYYEHIIRNGADLERIREYTRLNPQRWGEDSDAPQNL